jgi:hypothetical protein
MQKSLSNGIASDSHKEVPDHRLEYSSTDPSLSLTS